MHVIVCDWLCLQNEDDKKCVYFVHSVYIAISVNMCLHGVWESSLTNVSMCDWL